MAKIAREYADPLITLSQLHQTADQDLKEVIALRKILSDEEIMDFLRHRDVDLSDKNRLIQEYFSENFSDKLVTALYLMIDDHQAAYIHDTLEIYQAALHQQLGKMDARVVTAYPLSQEQEDRLKDWLDKRTGYDTALSVIVDESLIAGYQIQVSGYHFQGSVKDQLRQMAIQLKKGVDDLVEN